MNSNNTHEIAPYERLQRMYTGSSVHRPAWDRDDVAGVLAYWEVLESTGIECDALKAISTMEDLYMIATEVEAWHRARMGALPDDAARHAYLDDLETRRAAGRSRSEPQPVTRP